MARLPIKLIRVMRNAGLTVNEYPNWQTRGYENFQPRAVVCHATGGSLTSTDAGEMRTLWVNGSETAPAPIAQFYLSRSGKWTIGASGRCNHIGDAKLPNQDVSGNLYAIGIEAQHGPGEDWTTAQYLSYVIGVAAICRFYGWDTKHVYGHYEISYTGKTDPYFSMTRFRNEVEGIGMALTDDDIKRILTADMIPVPPVDTYGEEVEVNPDNPYWQLNNTLRLMVQELREFRGEVRRYHAEVMAVKADPATYDVVRQAVRDQLDDNSDT